MQGQWAREPAAALSAKVRRRLKIFARVGARRYPRGVAAVSRRCYHFRPPFCRSFRAFPAFFPRFVFFHAVARRPPPPAASVGPPAAAPNFFLGSSVANLYRANPLSSFYEIASTASSVLQGRVKLRAEPGKAQPKEAHGGRKSIAGCGMEEHRRERDTC